MPDWRIKAALQGSLARIPGGSRVNYRLQRAVGGLPFPDSELLAACDTVRLHLAAVDHHCQLSPTQARFFEFGAGWDLHVPIAMAMFGVMDQTVVDLNHHIRDDLVEHVVERLGQLRVPGACRQIGLPASGSIVDRLRAVGIDYRAPSDARATGLPDGSVDVVTSTNTLEHIPPQDLVAILDEMHRILSPDGILSMSIDYQDHYSYFDSSISAYNFLRFTDNQWRRYNNSLHFQNRLRHDHYVRLISESGFSIVDEQVRKPTSEDIETLSSIGVNSAGGHALDRIAIRGALIVAKPLTGRS